MAGPSVLIIGGTGVISTGIVKALKARGATLTLYNRGKSETGNPDGVELLTGDRNDVAAFEKTFAARRFDTVIDMICFRPEQAAADIRAFAGRTAQLIFTSTVCTYGNTQTIIPTTEATPVTPHSGYGRDKVACEKLFRQAHADGQFAVTIFRPSHTFGPPGSVLNNIGWGTYFIDRLRQGKPVIVSGDGHGLWQSAFADDVGVGFAAAAGRKVCYGQTYNIVGHDVFTWDEYTTRVAAALGAPAPRIVHVPTDLLLAVAAQRFGGLKDIFRYHGVYSNEKVYRDLPEYRHARTPFAEATRQTVAWMDSHGKVAASAGDRTEDQISAAMDRLTEALRSELAPPPA